MKPLITPARVAQIAFRAPDHIATEAISEAAIVAAQQRFVRPTVGDALYEALCRGHHPALVAEYLAPPLALYVKAAMLPLLAVQAGMAGVVELQSKSLTRAGDDKIRVAVRRLMAEADVLLRRALDHIEAMGAETYPEYDPSLNILNSCAIAGGMVLKK
jgi:hypothetical protein